LEGWVVDKLPRSVLSLGILHVRLKGHNSKIWDLRQDYQKTCDGLDYLCTYDPHWGHITPNWEVLNSIPHNGYVNENDITILDHDTWEKMEESNVQS
jgi:hypothetical protein